MKKARSKKKPPMTRGILFIALLILGGVLAWEQVEPLKNVSTVKSWPSVPGTVVESGVVGERAIRPRVVYEYIVDSITYRSESDLRAPMFGGKRKKYDAAEELAGDYPVGSEVTVRYNPDSTAQSTVTAFVTWDVYSKLGLALTLVLIGGIGLIFWLRARRIL